MIVKNDNHRFGRASQNKRVQIIDNVIEMPMVCIQCKREIADEMMFYQSEKGFICECCDGFHEELDKRGLTLVVEE